MEDFIVHVLKDADFSTLGATVQSVGGAGLVGGLSILLTSLFEIFARPAIKHAYRLYVLPNVDEIFDELNPKVIQLMKSCGSEEEFKSALLELAKNADPAFAGKSEGIQTRGVELLEAMFRPSVTAAELSNRNVSKD